jgi:hypothetical protein
MGRTAASIETRARELREDARATRASPRPTGPFLFAACCAALLSLAGCQRADADYQACASAAAAPVQAKQPVAPDVRKCMEAKGWRLLRPSLPPGANAWARLPPAGDALARRPALPEPGDHRPK